MKIHVVENAGKILENDEGELNMVIGISSDGALVLHFGKPVLWIGMRPEDAEALANQLLEKAAELKARRA